ncbi:DUF3226 domain-containing protein [Candidatus Venteria ishoeyi]|uniref:DUF4435 domain-containing protein n=1 Tax=Candidatus Venteria ishoeyi TaxID=1899563 RepID=A0A1H6FD68_9GAMM|nr:DUF3226 domain-containing protein [Candidatus Venteria ishoeyi]SEH07341.1 Uncharacterised protein [Candidatus Venteria ishoeyi]
MSSNCKYKGSQVLLVEGKNDCHVIMALCEKYNLKESFGLYECGGDENLLSRLDALVEEQDINTIGVVLDTDIPEKIPNLAVRWQQLAGILSTFGYSLPKAPEAQGTVLETLENHPRIGLWFMPNNHDPGMLEDFLMPLAETPTLEYAKYCVTQAEAKNLTRFKPVHRSKAILHTYLSWQDEPGKPLGQSLTSHALQHDHEIASSFANWLNRLFNS